MVRVFIKGVILDQVSDMPFIILQTEDKKKCMSLGIGPAEATAIIMAMEGIKAPRPLTHDLFAHFLARHHFVVDKVEIYDILDTKFYARLHYHRGFRKFMLELRPSDALALAVRLQTPIFVKKEIIEAQLNVNSIYQTDKYLQGDYTFYHKNDLEFLG